MSDYERDRVNNPREGEAQDDLPAALGSRLCALREAQGLTISDVNKDTKIQTKYIRMIEEGNFSSLPKGPFARSFVKQYCEYLRAEDLWQKYGMRYFESVKAKTADKTEDLPSYARSGEGFKKKSKILLYLAAFFSLAAAVFVTFTYRSSIKGESVSPIEGGTPAIIKEVKEKEAAEAEVERLTKKISEDAAKTAASVDLGWMDGKAPVETQPASTDAASRDTSQLGAEPTLAIYAEGGTWIKASCGGKTLFEGVIAKGSEQSFSPTAEAPLRIRYGRSANAKISWNGTEENITTSGKGLTKYYWYDGTITDTPQR